MKYIMQWIKKHKLITIIIILAVSGALYFFYGNGEEQESQAPTMQVVTAEQGDITVTVSGTGQVAAANQVDLKPQIAGDGVDIIEVAVNNDQAVAEGDLIAVLDTTEIQKTIRETQLSLNSAEIQMKQTERQYDNQTKDDKYARQLQEISLEQKQISLNNAYEDLEDYYIRAPFDGIVTGLDFSAGDSISRDEVLASIITEELVVEISLNEVDAVQVEQGDPVYLTFDALDNATAEGVVSKIDTIGTVESGVVTYDVEITFESPSNLLKPGMSATADIEIESAQDVITVPIDAVQSNNNGDFVMVKSDAGTPKRTSIEAGITDDAMIEIVSGINAGDDVIIMSTTASASSNSDEDEESSSSILQMGPGRGMGGGRPPE
jgi:RND family efflux transporter MFP subunit